VKPSNIAIWSLQNRFYNIPLVHWTSCHGCHKRCGKVGGASELFFSFWVVGKYINWGEGKLPKLLSASFIMLRGNTCEYAYVHIHMYIVKWQLLKMTFVWLEGWGKNDMGAEGAAAAPQPLPPAIQQHYRLLAVFSVRWQRSDVLINIHRFLLKCSHSRFTV